MANERTGSKNWYGWLTKLHNLVNKRDNHNQDMNANTPEPAAPKELAIKSPRGNPGRYYDQFTTAEEVFAHPPKPEDIVFGPDDFKAEAMMTDYFKNASDERT